MTKIKTVRQRLELYKMALKDYEGKGEANPAYLECGFCLYFKRIHCIYLYDSGSKDKLPELYEVAPKKKRDNLGENWFAEDGPTTYRIRTLKKAIAICEKLIGNKE